MKFGVLGTGMVGATLGSKLVELHHEVAMGARTAGNERAADWAGRAGDRAAHGTFADAAAFGEIVVNATAGTASLGALAAARAANLRGKILIDIANPLDFSAGMPPTLAVANTDSLGERIQRAFPAARVVKTLNTMNCAVMVEPTALAGPHDVFLSGDDAGAKDQVRALLASFGWPPRSIIDLGGISTARGPEMYLPLWLRLWGALGTGAFNIHVSR